MSRSVCTTGRRAGRPDCERGANLVEYILLITLVALAVIAAVVFLRGQVSDKFGDAGSKISSNGTPAPAPAPAPTLVVCGAWVERTDVLADALTGLQPGCPENG
jgi:Flp pilus assembly pilin Flp